LRFFISLFYQKAVLEASLRLRKPSIGPEQHALSLRLCCVLMAVLGPWVERRENMRVITGYFVSPFLAYLYINPFNEIALVFATVSDHNLTR